MTEWISNLPLTREISVGSIRVHAIESGIQWLDGGAMFGVVPKPLWERRIPPDDQNRIPLALRCLVIESPDELVLVDTGIGNKESEKFHDLYGVENAGNPFGGRHTSRGIHTGGCGDCIVHPPPL